MDVGVLSARLASANGMQGDDRGTDMASGVPQIIPLQRQRCATEILCAFYHMASARKDHVWTQFYSLLDN